MSTRKVPDLQTVLTGLLAFVFVLPADLIISAHFNHILVSWLMAVLLIVWVYTATYSARNLRQFEGSDRWLLLVIAFFAPVIAFLIWNCRLGQLPESEDQST